MKVWEDVETSYVKMNWIKDASNSVIVAGFLMFFSFLIYYSLLFYESFSDLSNLIISWWYVTPYFVDPINIRMFLFSFRADFPVISIALNYILTGPPFLIFLPFIFTITILIIGILIRKEKGSIRVFEWLLPVLLILAILTFSPTFLPMTPITLLLVVFLGSSVILVLYAIWILLRLTSKTKHVPKVEYISPEEYWRQIRRFPRDAVIYASIIFFLASMAFILVYMVWSAQQAQNSFNISKLLGILESML